MIMQVISNHLSEDWNNQLNTTFLILVLLYPFSKATQANAKMSMKCSCQSKHCRGLIKGDDWKIPKLQERYKGHFLPYIQRKIDKENS